MNALGLTETKYKNVACYDKKTGVNIPEGYIMTSLGVNQLKLIKVPYAKAHVGYGHLNTGRVIPLIVNIIRIEDKEKAFKHQQKLYIMKEYNISDVDFLFN